MAEFVVEIPEVEIVDGLVHTRLGGCEWYWKPSTFRAFVEQGQRTLDAFVISTHAPPRLRKVD